MPDHTPVKASETSGVQNQPKNTSLENPDLVKNSVLQVDTAATSTNSSEPRSPDSLPELSPTSTTSTSTSSQQTASQQVEEGSREYSWDELNNMSHEELLAISAKLGLRMYLILSARDSANP